MFCPNCGQEISDDAKFCSGCGQPVVFETVDPVPEASAQETPAPEIPVQEASAPEAEAPRFSSQETDRQTSDDSGEKKEKRSLKEFFSGDNIEKVGAAAVFLPLIMTLVVGVVGGILRLPVMAVGGGFLLVIYKIIMFVLRLVFVAAAIAAEVGLIMHVLKEKDTSDINVWIVPAALFLAVIACICRFFGLSVVCWIFAVIDIILGLEFMSRIVLAGKPMESAIDPAGAVNTYKEYISDYRAKYPTSKELEKAGYVDPENSKFDGAGVELFGYSILAGLVSVVTCGIAAPWMICKIYRWRLEHTVINGKRLTFTGSGGSLLGHWILWELLTIVTCGIYGFYVHIALKKWELEHTYIQGEPVMANGHESFFDGDIFSYVGYSLLASILLLVTCGLAYPWVMVMLQKWETSHEVINNRRLAFSGTALGFLGEYLIILLFSIITCGIYSSWGTVRMNKYIIRNTDFVD